MYLEWCWQLLPFLPSLHCSSEVQNVMGAKSFWKSKADLLLPSAELPCLPPGEAVVWKAREIKNSSRVIAEKFHSVIFLFITLSSAAMMGLVIFPFVYFMYFVFPSSEKWLQNEKFVRRWSSARLWNSFHTVECEQALEKCCLIKLLL